MRFLRCRLLSFAVPPAASTGFQVRECGGGAQDGGIDEYPDFPYAKRHGHATHGCG